MTTTTDPGGVVSEANEDEAGRGRRVGDAPKPRVLLSWEGPERDQVAADLALHAPTVVEIRSFDEVNQVDYDVFVTDRMAAILDPQIYGKSPTGPDGHLFVGSFVGRTGSHAWGRADLVWHPRYTMIEWADGHLSRPVEIPHDVLTAVVDLVEDDLVPVARSRSAHTTMSVKGRTTGGALSMPDLSALSGEQGTQPAPRPLAELHPMLRTPAPGPKVLAAWYMRSEQSEGWVLPSDVRRPWDWVAAALRHWAITYRQFPLVGGWWEMPAWQTRPEAAGERTKALKADLAATTARLVAETAAATAALEDAARNAAGGLRRLLTEKGDPLKDAVADALGRLGYQVIDRDAQPPPDAGGKIEDLGVVDPDDPAADPIVEVKGYDTGAKAGDFGLMVRHLVRALKTDRSPTAIWWVANTWRRRSPDDRPVVLAGEGPMIDEHAGEEVPLVVIDTRGIFRAVRAIEDGQVTAAAVRASLRAARGRWAGVCSGLAQVSRARGA